ncbi:MAG: hypothetical protein ACOY4U_05735 [Pseudomonadota bacterium]
MPERKIHDALHLLWSLFTGDYWNRKSLEEAIARVEALLEEHREAEIAAAWPDTRWGLFELGNIRDIVQAVASDASSGREFLVRLEAVLSERRKHYVPRGEYSSDLGRLGSFASDIKDMLDKSQ